MRKIVHYFGLLMVAVYLGVGVIMIMGTSSLITLPRTYSLILGIAFVLYALFRGYRIITTNTNSEES